MKTYRQYRMYYQVYAVVFLYSVSLLYYNIARRFDIEITVIYSLVLSLFILVIRREKIELKENEIESGSYLWMKKRVVSYSDIGYITLDKYEHALGRLLSPAILITDKKRKKSIHILYKFYRKEDIREILEYIKGSSKKVVFDSDVKFLFMNERLG